MRVIHFQKSFSEETIEKNRQLLRAGLWAAGLFALMVFGYQYFKHGNFISAWWAALPFLLTTILITRDDRKPLLRELGWAERGADGESKVVKIFTDKLDDSYTYICNYADPNFKRGDVDGIVVGPKGIFVIEVKNWRGSFRVSGPDMYRHISGHEYRLFKSPIDQVNNAADFIKQALAKGNMTMPVRPFVILEGGYVKEFRGSTGVFIGNPEKILQEIVASQTVICDRDKVLAALGIPKQTTPNLV